MIKNIIAPVQAWLLSQKRCVGCGTSLKLGKKSQKKDKILITCKCRRIYVFDEKTNKYRRAQLNEI